MAKTNYYKYCILFITLVVSLNLKGSDTIKYSPEVTRLREVYLSQLGVTELTGNNDGPEVKAYLAFTGLPEGNPWCAAYVAWCLHTAGIKALKSAWAPSWFPAHKVIYTHGAVGNKTPMPGDVFGIYFASKKRIAHVGFVEKWTKGASCFVTNEGNSNEKGSRTGGSVVTLFRLKTQVNKISRYADQTIPTNSSNSANSRTITSLSANNKSL